MSKQHDEFINYIAPIICEQAAKRGYKFPSAIISQACREGNFGRSQLAAKHHNHFGMKAGSSWKGKKVCYSTKEEYTEGKLTTIKAYFRSYPDDIEGIKGFFDFINTKRYKNLKEATSPENYLELIKADEYATDYKYVANNMKYITIYNLTRFDPEPTESEPVQDLETVAREVIQGKWGVYPERKKMLERAGYVYRDVQNIVNKLMKG